MTSPNPNSNEETTLIELEKKFPVLAAIRRSPFPTPRVCYPRMVSILQIAVLLSEHETSMLLLAYFGREPPACQSLRAAALLSPTKSGRNVHPSPRVGFQVTSNSNEKKCSPPS